jgi:dTDP-4-dehydrorhamnose reductase
MKILVAGCRGQLGRSIVEALRAHRIEAAARDRLDITRLEQVRDAVDSVRPDLVINAAAYNDVDRAESEALEANRVNALGPRNLALAAMARRASILHVSTDYVFDGASDRPYHEYDFARPLSAYGRSKLAGEQAVKDLNPRHYILRTAWLYHPGGKNFLNTMRSLSGSPQVKAVHDQISSPTYAPHLATAIAKLIETEAYGVYHLAGHGQASRYEMTRMLFELLGLQTPVLPASHTEFPAAAVRPRYSALTSIQEPRILLPPWQEGIRAFADALG